MRQWDSCDTVRGMSTRLLTIDEAIQALGMSRSTLWRRLQRGDLPSVRRGGRRLVRVTTARRSPRGMATSDIPPFTESHPIFRLIGVGAAVANYPAPATNTRSWTHEHKAGILWDPSAILAAGCRRRADHERAVATDNSIKLRWQDPQSSVFATAPGRSKLADFRSGDWHTAKALHSRYRLRVYA